MVPWNMVLSYLAIYRLGWVDDLLRNKMDGLVRAFTTYPSHSRCNYLIFCKNKKKLDSFIHLGI